MTYAMAERNGVLPGALELMILKTLTRGVLHGYGIAQSIRRSSEDVLTVEEGSLYPALHRLLVRDAGAGRVGCDGDKSPRPDVHADGGGVPSAGSRTRQFS